jgi:hypothetical protein
MTNADIIISVKLQLENAKKAIQGLTKELSFMEPRFKGWALSVLFLGQNMQKTFSSIWRASQKTFQDVMHSTEGTVTGFDILNGTLDYLKFSAGQALEPLAMAFVPIIDGMTEWISNNEEAFRTTVALTGGLGVLLGTAASIILLEGAFLRLGKALLFMEGVLKLILGSKVIGLIFNNVPVITMIVAIGLMIGALIKLGDQMGGVGEFFKSVIRGILRAFVFLGDGIVTIMSSAFGIVMSGVNLLIKAINALTQNSIVKKAASMLGFNVEKIKIPEIPANQYKFGDLAARYLEWEQSSVLAPSKGYAEGMEQGKLIYNNTININGMDQKTSKDLANMIGKDISDRFSKYVGQ